LILEFGGKSWSNDSFLVASNFLGLCMAIQG
jgi:hypothetical protein